MIKIAIAIGAVVVLAVVALTISLCMAAKWADDRMDEMMEDSE